MPPQVKLAPSIRLALRQCKAKDGDATSNPAKDRYLLQRAREEIALLSCANLKAGMGNFWASDSDSECEDLGDAEVLASGRCVSVAGGVPSSRRSNIHKEASIPTVTPYSQRSRPGS